MERDRAKLCCMVNPFTYCSICLRKYCLSCIDDSRKEYDSVMSEGTNISWITSAACPHCKVVHKWHEWMNIHLTKNQAVNK